MRDVIRYLSKQQNKSSYLPSLILISVFTCNSSFASMYDILYVRIINNYLPLRIYRVGCLYCIFPVVVRYSRGNLLNQSSAFTSAFAYDYFSLMLSPNCISLTIFFISSFLFKHRFKCNHLVHTFS